VGITFTAVHITLHLQLQRSARILHEPTSALATTVRPVCSITFVPHPRSAARRAPPPAPDVRRQSPPHRMKRSASSWLLISIEIPSPGRLLVRALYSRTHLPPAKHTVSSKKAGQDHTRAAHTQRFSRSQSSHSSSDPAQRVWHVIGALKYRSEVGWFELVRACVVPEWKRRSEDPSISPGWRPTRPFVAQGQSVKCGT